MTELKVKCESCGHLQRLFDYDKHTFDIPANHNEAFNKWLEEHDKQIRAEAEKEHELMCETCIHKVSKEDIEQIRAEVIDEFINQIEKQTTFYCGKDSNLMRIAEELKEQNK